MGDETRLALYGALLVAAGFGSGFAGGLFGIGGGLLRVPIFLYIFPAFDAESSIAMHTAAGTSLALALPTSLRSAASQRRSGNLDPSFLRSWIPSLLVGVLLGLFAMRFLSGTTLTLLFGIAAILIALEMIIPRSDFCLTNRVPGHPVRDLMAAGIGGVSTMIGLSGGSFTTPVLTIFGYPIHRAVAVSAAGSIAISMVGGVGSVINGLGVQGRVAWSIGYVDVIAFAVMLPAILISAPLGVRLANRLSESRLRRSFGVFLLVVAGDMLRQALAGS